MACMPAMRRRTFRNHLSFPESMANMRMGLRPMLLPHGREILPEHPDTCSGGNVASESATLVWRRKKAGASSRCYGNTLRRFLGPSPTVGNGPRRTRRLRSRPQHGTRPGHVPTCRRTDVLQKFCRLTPPAFAGSSHRQTARGGRSKSCPLSVVANSVLFSKNRASQSACRHGSTVRSEFKGSKGHPTASSVLVLR